MRGKVDQSALVSAVPPLAHRSRSAETKIGPHGLHPLPASAGLLCSREAYLSEVGVRAEQAAAGRNVAAELLT